MDATRFGSLGLTEMGFITPIRLTEALSLRHETFAKQKIFSARGKELNSICSKFTRLKNLGSRFRVRAKRSNFQVTDYQGYAKPSHLKRATEVEICMKSSLEILLSSLKGDESQSLYKVEISTSKLYGSNLSDLSAGILLCLIDEMGNSILQRIPASLMMYHSTEKYILDDYQILSFQRGSFDEFVFKGPKLGTIEAIWLSIESGQWRVGSLSLTVISWFQPLIEKPDGGKLSYTGLKFEFPAKDILLGDGSANPMVELKPYHVTELSGAEALSISNQSSSSSDLASIDSKSNEESMREYADLKFSLLLYDVILIFTGTAVASFSAGENSGFAFLVGGILGFLYLLLLQRSVDELPAPISISETTQNEDRPFAGYKGTLSTMALAIGFANFAVKYTLGDSAVMATPKEIVIGLLGFLACKVAVVLAAVKPRALSQKENE